MKTPKTQFCYPTPSGTKKISIIPYAIGGRLYTEDELKSHWLGVLADSGFNLDPDQVKIINYPK